MRVVVTSDRRYTVDAHGQVWTASIFDREYFRRYLGVFDEVRVVARVLAAGAPNGDWRRVDGPGVTVHALPHFVGPVGFARRLPRALLAAARAFGPDDAVILRGGSPSLCLMPFLTLSRHPYGLEVVGDPADVFAQGSVQHPLAGLTRRWSSRELKRRAKAACAVAYVTELYLQRRYPPGPCAFTTHYSSADLTDEAFAASPPCFSAGTEPCRLVAVGTMEQRYKGQDVLLHAVRRCVEAGTDLTLVLVGDGRHRPELEALSDVLGLSGRVTFAGELPGAEAVRRVLAGSRLFVHPSRAEGLPRVVIEAMAQALPCIATTVGGTPELLPPDDMVPPGDAAALAWKICSVLADRERLSRMSQRNLARAREYHRSLLQSRREELFHRVRLCTEEFAEHAHCRVHVPTRSLARAHPQPCDSQVTGRTWPAAGKSTAGATSTGGQGVVE
jgi:hypothetical protein